MSRALAIRLGNRELTEDVGPCNDAVRHGRRKEGVRESGHGEGECREHRRRHHESQPILIV